MNSPTQFGRARFAVDLHMHSTMSDGLLTPREVVELAAVRGVKALALTDHDTTRGLAAAEMVAKEHDIELIPGVEISAWMDREVHILGYFIDRHEPKLSRCLEQMRGARAERVEEICRRLTALGKPLTPEQVHAEGDWNLGRPHVARALLTAGHVASFAEAFRRYLGNDGPAYVPAARLSVREAIQLIHGAGGIAVVAHPAVDGIIDSMPQMSSWGLDGVEIAHPAHSRQARRTLKQTAKRLGLLATGGSDFHTPASPYGIGHCGITEEALAMLRAHCADLAA